MSSPYGLVSGAVFFGVSLSLGTPWSDGFLFAVGVYFELHPHDRHDLWSAAGVAAVALLNSGALTLPPTAVSAHFVLRLRRIARIANSLLLLMALVIVALETLLDGRHAALHGVALVVPPLLTIVALRRLQPPA